MGLFRKKQPHTADETMESTYHEEDISSVPREVTAGKRNNRRSVGRWICGSPASKESLEADNKIQHKNSSSTSSSHEDKRDDRQVFNATTRKASASSSRERQQMMDFDMANSIVCSLPPPAAKAAFDGPPRFDWIDIEHNAATRVQKVFRRHLVLQEMEHEGLTTSYIRNRRRQRKAKANFFPTSVDGNAPELGFGCCSMGMAFGNSNFDPSDTIAYKNFQRKQYEEKTKAQKDREEFLSQSYLEQKGIHSKVHELEQTMFLRDEMLVGL